MANYEMICKHRTVFTPEEILEMELEQEKELSGIKREYTLMNRDHWNLLLGSDAEMVKFKSVLKILKKECRNVSNDHTIATSKAKVAQDLEVQAQMKEMLHENTILRDQIKRKLVDIRETEDQIRRINRELQKLRISQLTDDQYQQKNIEGQRTVEKLENRLDMQVKKFGTITSDNRKLREEIDHLLIERTFFNVLWERQVGGMYKRKKCLLDLLQQATVAYNKRDEWVATLDALRSKVYKDLVMDREEMNKLQHFLDHNEKLSDFIETKQQIRCMKDLEAITRRRKRLERLRDQEKCEQYMAIVSEIQSATQETDTNQMRAVFLKQEAENDSNFLLVTHINADIDNIGMSLQELVAEIEEKQLVNQRRAELQEQKIEELTLKLEEATQEADEAEAELAEKTQNLDTIFAAVDRVFTNIKCSKTPFMELLGDNETINRYNVLLYLDAVQSKIYDVVLTALFKQKTEKKKNAPPTKIIETDKFYAPPLDVDEYVDKNPCPLCVEQEMVSDVIDTLQFARTKEEAALHLSDRLALPDGAFSLHSVSFCHLPKSREIIQKRYQ